MGKRMLITNADFSANGIARGTITWYITEYTDESSQLTNSFYAARAYTPYSWLSLRGRTINCLKTNVGVVGTITLYTGTISGTTTTITKTRNISASRTGEQTFYFDDLAIGSDEYLFITNSVDGVTKYARGTTEGTKSRYFTKSNRSTTDWDNATINLGCDFGFRD